MRLAVVACGAGIALGACSHASAPSAAEPWHVANGFLRDTDGRALVLRGMNLSGQHKYAPHFDFQTAEDFARVRTDWGMNAIRFLLVWAAVEPERGVYDDGYLDAVAERMRWARDANLMVVLDMHQDVYGEGFVSGGGDGAPLWSCDASHYASFVPTTPWYFNDLSADVTACYDGLWTSDDLQSHYIEAWRRVAARLAGYDDVVVGLDVMNEPYWGSYSINAFETDRLEPFYEKLVPVVRSVAPTWMAFLEPSTSRNLGGTTRLTPPTFPGIVYSPHSYDRNAESGMGFDPANRGAIISNIAALREEATSLGAALWIGEYGGSASESGIADYMTATYDGAGAVAASSMYWDYSKGGYGVLNADGTEAWPLLDTLVRPYPERVAGDPVSFAYDAPTSTFTLTYHADPRVTAPTVISVPARRYPGGYHVDCGGCASTQAGASLVVTAPPPGDPAVITLRP